MNKKTIYKIAVIGGDKRQATVACELTRKGHSVCCYGLDEHASSLSGCELCATADKAIGSADIAILPLPVTRDGIHVTSSSKKTAFSEIVKSAKRNGTLLLGGSLPQNFSIECQENGVEIIDYYKNEGLQSKNALPSAEGALMIAMEHTDITVSGMKVLITGYGRIGKLLADILRSLKAHVTVAARRDETLCEISMSGFSATRTDTESLSRAASECDVIFNTVPNVIFNENILKNVKNKPLYIEIASSPGGIEAKTARNAGIEIIYAPSLPGKYSPKSAGKYVFETISEILSERRIKL